jgi:hypothetical protein
MSCEIRIYPSRVTSFPQAAREGFTSNLESTSNMKLPAKSKTENKRIPTTRTISNDTSS